MLDQLSDQIDYSMSIRKTADATASFVIFETGKGKVDEHTFVLN